MLDIIIPHYKEPWEVGRKMFDMLDLQRGIDFDSIKVVLVNDGEEYALPESFFSGRSYQVEQITIPHAGVSAARNTGLKAATAEWVMFCDFDDTFTHIYALHDIMEVLPAPGFDMLWTDLYIENGKDGCWQLIKKEKEDAVFTHGKLFRRQCLIDNDMWFNTDLIFNEDSEFNAIFHTKVNFKRTGKLAMPTPPYVWLWREGSTSNSGREVEAILGHYKRNKSVCKAFEERMPLFRYCAMVTRTVYDTYYALNVSNLPPDLKEMRSDFREWFLDHKRFFGQVDDVSLRKIIAISKAEYRKDDFDESISIGQWLTCLETNE